MGAGWVIHSGVGELRKAGREPTGHLQVETWAQQEWMSGGKGMLWWIRPPFPSLGAEAKGQAKAEWQGRDFNKVSLKELLEELRPQSSGNELEALQAGSGFVNTHLLLSKRRTPDSKSQT